MPKTYITPLAVTVNEFAAAHGSAASILIGHEPSRQARNCNFRATVTPTATDMIDGYVVCTRSCGAGSMRYRTFGTYEAALEYALGWANRKAREMGVREAA